MKKLLCLSALVCGALSIATQAAFAQDAAPAASVPLPADPVAAARFWTLVGDYAKAAAILKAEITQGADGEQKDVARVLFKSIPNTDRSRNPVKFDPGTPGNSEAVQAEEAREKIVTLSNTGKRVDAVDAFKAFVKAFPNQLTPYDYWIAVQAAFAAKLPRDVTAFLAEGNARFPDDSLMQLVNVLPLHWSNDSVEGIKITQKVEATAPEPLLSLARSRELTFLSGNFDNPDRVEQAKKVAMEIITAGQMDPKIVLAPMMGMLASVDHRDGAATWLVEISAKITDPAIAAQMYTSAIKEFIRVGEVEDARKQVETWKTSDLDAALIGDLQKLVDAAAWSISGKVPAALLEGGSNWRVTAVAPSLTGSDGALVLDQSTPVGKDGSFSVPAPGTSIIGLLLSGDGADGKFIVKELGRGIKPEHKAGDAAYPGDVVLPPVAPAAEASLAPNEIALKYDFGMGEDFSDQLIEVTVPKPADFDPAKLIVKQQCTLAPGAPLALPAQILEVGDKTIKVGVWRGLKQGENARLQVLFDGSAPPGAMPGKVTTSPDNPGTVVDTGPAQFRIVSSGAVTDPNDSGYVLAVRGPDNVWHGSTAWSGSEKPVKVTVKPGLTGPIRTSFVCHYEFSNGASRDVTLSFDAGQPYVLIDENGKGAKAGDWTWTLKSDEGFDVAYHACRPFHTMEPLVKRNPQFGAYLRDYCYFNGGNGDSLFIGATRRPNNPAGRDAVTVFEVHPGDWTNPGNPNNLPLDDAPDAPWEHPERYCGSKNTQIAVLVSKDGEMPFNIPATAGIRRWGISVTDQKAADPIDDRDIHAVWSIQRLLHTFSRGDINRFLPMKLSWPVGAPGVVRDTIAKRLPQLSSDIKSGLYAKAQADLLPMGFLGAGTGNLVLVGAEKRDPALVWLGWRVVYTLLHGYGEGCLSIDTTQQGDKTVGCGDLLNMVGDRGYTSSVVDYAVAEDLGLVTDAEREDVRRNAALIAYRFIDPDTMNYHANAGQPNFEADRLLQLSCFPAMFPDHPESDAMAHNVAKYTADMLMHWTIRDGGKWAENIGCYYLHSFNCTTMNLYFLNSLGLADEVIKSPYFEPFCRFGMNTLQTPQPADGKWLKTAGVATDAGPLIRKVPGMGAHGEEGGTGVGMNSILMAQLTEKLNPKLSADLTALWEAGGQVIGPLQEGSYGEYPTRFLFFCRPEYPAEKLTLEPMRLPGWGMIMRDAAGTDNEFYLAFRAGTKAYRDVGNGSEFVMGGLGKLLSADGGDIGGPDQRTNLLIDPGTGPYWPMPMGPVTRWLISDAVEFARGEFKSTPDDPNVCSRDLLFARGNYLLVHDEVKDSHNFPGVFNFATPAVEITPTPQGALAKGKLGVDLWITKLDETQPEFKVEDMGFGGERVSVPNEWHQLVMRVPIGMAGTMLLYPVKSGGAAPQIKKVGEGIWQISGDGFNDTYFDGNGTIDGGSSGSIVFQGKMGLWRPAEGGRPASFSILNGDSVSVGGKALTATEPTTFEFDGTNVKSTTGNNQKK